MARFDALAIDVLIESWTSTGAVSPEDVFNLMRTSRKWFAELSRRGVRRRLLEGYVRNEARELTAADPVFAADAGTIVYYSYIRASALVQAVRDMVARRRWARSSKTCDFGALWRRKRGAKHETAGDADQALIDHVLVTNTMIVLSALLSLATVLMDDDDDDDEEDAGGGLGAVGRNTKEKSGSDVRIWALYAMFHFVGQLWSDRCPTLLGNDKLTTHLVHLADVALASACCRSSQSTSPPSLASYATSLSSSAEVCVEWRCRNDDAARRKLRWLVSRVKIKMTRGTTNGGEEDD